MAKMAPVSEPLEPEAWCSNRDEQEVWTTNGERKILDFNGSDEPRGVHDTSMLATNNLIAPFHQSEMILPNFQINEHAYLANYFPTTAQSNCSTIQSDVGFGLDEACFDRQISAFKLNKSFDCTAIAEHSLSDEALRSYLTRLELPWPDTLFNPFDAQTASSNVMYQELATPDLTQSSTPTSLPPQASSSRVSAASMDAFDTDDQRWHATLTRSRAADRAFLYGVLSTKIFCRPSCASRRPSRRHIQFFPFPGAIEAAEQAKFRPCKRCIPNAPGVKTSSLPGICEVLRLIIGEIFNFSNTGVNAALKLEALAKSAGSSVFHFHRTFKATTQVTPGDFIHACRVLALQDTLRNGSIHSSHFTADALTLSGQFSSWSLRTARKALGGVSPTEYADGLHSTDVRYCYAISPRGPVYVVYSVEEGHSQFKLHGILLGEHAEEQVGHGFTAAKSSIQYDERLRRCVTELEEESRDWDTELPADILESTCLAQTCSAVGQIRLAVASGRFGLETIHKYYGLHQLSGTWVLGRVQLMVRPSLHGSVQTWTSTKVSCHITYDRCVLCAR